MFPENIIINYFIIFIFHYDFYAKPKVDLEDAEITPKIKQKLTDLWQKYDDSMNKQSSDIGLTHLAEMKSTLTQIYPLWQVNLTHYP